MPSDIKYNKIANSSIKTKKTKSMEIEEDEEDYEDFPVGAGLEWTTRKKLLLLSISLVAGIAFGNLTSIMPYFPNVVSTL